MNFLFRLLLLLLVFSFSASLALAEDKDKYQQNIQPILQNRCVKCHGAKEEIEGDVNLQQIKTLAQLKKDPELLSTIIDAVEFESMPPETEPSLAELERKRLVNEMQLVLHSVIGGKKNFAPTPIRRMNRFQYNNAVQDLFQLKVVVFPLPERMMREYGNYFQPASGKMPATLKAGSRPLGKSQMIEPRLSGVTAFPQDLRAEHGFDNRGDHLSMSPLLMESFLKLSRSIVNSREFNPNTVGIWPEFLRLQQNNHNLSMLYKHDSRSFSREPFANRSIVKPCSDTPILW